MKIEKSFGYITYFEIDNSEEGFEDMEGIQIDTLSINVESRDKGNGRELLREAIADIKNDFPGQDIYLICCPKDMNTNFSKLASFYESEGFEVVESDMPYPLMKI